MKSLSALTPRSAVLDGTADFVVNLADLATLTEAEAREFLDSNVLTSGMELLLSQAFARMAGLGNASGIYKLSESMGGGQDSDRDRGRHPGAFPASSASLGLS
jgi:hypothetical protein